MSINNQLPNVGDEFISQGYIYNQNTGGTTYVTPWLLGQTHHFPQNPPFGTPGNPGEQRTDQYGFDYTWNGSYWAANNPSEIKQVSIDDGPGLDPTQNVENAVFKVTNVYDCSVEQCINLPQGNCESGQTRVPDTKNISDMPELTEIRESKKLRKLIKKWRKNNL